MLFFAVHISYIPPRANRTRRRFARVSSSFHQTVSGNETTRERFLSLAKCSLESLFKSAFVDCLHIRWNRSHLSNDVVALATLGGARSDRKTKSFSREPKNHHVGGPASRRPTLRTPPPFVSASPPRAHFLSSRCRVCLRRYGLYFMSSRRSEVLRRFCGANERDRIES